VLALAKAINSAVSSQSAPDQGVERRADARHRAGSPNGGCGEASVGKKRRKPGRKRRGRSLGRYPFLSLLALFVAAIEGFYTPSTVAEMHRKLRKLSWDLRRLKKEGRIRTDNPLKMGSMDVMGLVKDMRDRGLSVNTISRQLGQLRVFLDWCGNPVITNLQKQNKQAIPKQRVRRLPSLNESEVNKLMAAAGSMPGWRGDVACLMVAIYAYCGLRMSELRLAHFEDLDCRTWTIYVRHPKGEATWGEKRAVYIPEPARAHVVRFVRARVFTAYKRGLDGLEPLIPSFSPRGKAGFYTSQGISSIKRAVERKAGVKFEIRTLRRTYGQILLDRGVLIDTVSKSMGHSSTKTTEMYYCRKSDAMVRDEIDRAWSSADSSEDSKKTAKCKNDLIETEKYLSGYA
jgi:integrase/recombinase XerD